MGKPIHLFLLVLIGATMCGADEPTPMSSEQRAVWQSRVEEMRAAMAHLTGNDAPNATVFLKGIEWALHYGTAFSDADLQTLDWAYIEGLARTSAMDARPTGLDLGKGSVPRAYQSQVDHSIQPYGVIIPEHYDPKIPMRLDVVLHGSTRPVPMTELNFLKKFKAEASTTSPNPGTTNKPPPFLELHPLGRVENCYRFAGETDVFEAIEDVCRHYAVDRRRIVLRGMSMGASGTWHLGLKHPDRFVALGPYCGYVDTHRFSATPYPNFVKVGVLPQHQEAGLHMLDSVDYAANARMVPAIACMGDKDPFFDAHVIMGEAMAREGIVMVNLISRGTAHQVDPVVHAEQMRRITEISDVGRPTAPAEIHFTTWTLKYSKCYWVQVLGLAKHYERADIVAQSIGDRVAMKTLKNIARFAINAAELPSRLKFIEIGNQILDVSRENGSQIVVELHDGVWRVAVQDNTTTGRGKVPGVQGPIDDAFTSPFLCVRGTKTPQHPLAHQYAMASLERFAADWHLYFRGELPIKDDRDVTAGDVMTKNLILFGDPGSNHWIADALPHLPI
ncbi:MAG: prolyl oligopeptidase family serine peptidase, partial [Planctomycetota bacterium]|nr:prolyl oligopeptidase family serine peptidase [Planctomycetota bacterium]